MNDSIFDAYQDGYEDGRSGVLKDLKMCGACIHLRHFYHTRNPSKGFFYCVHHWYFGRLPLEDYKVECYGSCDKWEEVK